MPTINLSASVGRNGVNNPSDVRTVKRRLIELGFNWLQPDTVPGPETIKTIQLFQAIKNGLNVVADPRNDGLISPGGDTHQWLQATNAPQWMLMPAGSKREGFINDELADISDNHDFGTAWLAAAWSAIGQDYKNEYHNIHPTAAVIRINDISLPRGGPTPSHATHQAGMCCDLKLPRLNGQSGGITYNDLQYDQLTTRAILEALWRYPQTSRVFFNDPALVAEGLCQAVSGHDNHIHFEIKPPVRVFGATRSRR
jgi:peptidoglycan hydrolase-like protein with peptidoglycan-binding domain